MEQQLQQVKTYVIQEFKAADTSKLYYHNLAHTKGVVLNVESIIKAVELDVEAAFLLKTAAWWHDIGYLYGYEEHEQRGMRLAATLLPPMGFEPKQIEVIVELIAATELGQAPKSTLQALLADADLAYGVTQNFIACGNQLRKEWAWYKNQSYTEKEWLKSQLKFLQSVNFHSDFGKKNYQPLVKENLKKISQQLASLSKE